MLTLRLNTMCGFIILKLGEPTMWSVVKLDFFFKFSSSKKHVQLLYIFYDIYLFRSVGGYISGHVSMQSS